MTNVLSYYNSLCVQAMGRTSVFCLKSANQFPVCGQLHPLHSELYKMPSKSANLSSYRGCPLPCSEEQTGKRVSSKHL